MSKAANVAQARPQALKNLANVADVGAVLINRGLREKHLSRRSHEPDCLVLTVSETGTDVPVPVFQADTGVPGEG